MLWTAYVLGQDPAQIERLVSDLHHVVMIWARRGLAMCAVSGRRLPAPGAVSVRTIVTSMPASAP